MIYKQKYIWWAFVWYEKQALLLIVSYSIKETNHWYYNEISVSVQDCGISIADTTVFH